MYLKLPSPQLSKMFLGLSALADKSGAGYLAGDLKPAILDTSGKSSGKDVSSSDTEYSLLYNIMFVDDSRSCTSKSLPGEFKG